MTKENTIIAVHETHIQAEDTIKELGRSGFDMKKLSIIAHGDAADIERAKEIMTRRHKREVASDVVSHGGPATAVPRSLRRLGRSRMARSMGRP